jgi:hypothetical protein
MSLNPGTLIPIMQGALASFGIIGIYSPMLATGLANGLSLYATTGIRVVTVDTGTVGSGTGIGTSIILPSPAIATAMSGTFPSHTIAGIYAPTLIGAISLGFMQSFVIALVTTVDPSVGVGVGVVKLVPNPAVSSMSFISGFIAAGIVGIYSSVLAQAVAEGLDIALLSATGVTVIAGPPSPSPSSGIGIGTLS